MAKQAKIQSEYEVLVLAADIFKDALMEFRRTYDPSTVGIVEFMEHIDDVLYDISEDIEVEMERN